MRDNMICVTVAGLAGGRTRQLCCSSCVSLGRSVPIRGRGGDAALEAGIVRGPAGALRQVGLPRCQIIRLPSASGHAPRCSV